MITNDNIKEFMSQNFPYVEGLSYTRIELPIDKIKSFEKEINKPFEQFSQSDFITVFENSNWTARNTFISNKSVIKQFASWYFENIVGLDNIPFGHPKVSPIEFIELEDVSSEERYRKEYFKDYTDYFDCIEEMFGLESNDQYVMHKVFFALMWEGITRNEVRTLKKDDVEDGVDDGDAYIIIKLPDRQIYVKEKRTVKIVKRAIEADGYEREQKNGRARSYEFTKTNMLLRNTSKKPVGINQTISESTINNYFTEQIKIANALPESNPYYGKHMVFRGISDSAAFYRLIMDGKRDHVTQEDIAQARQVISVSAGIVDSFNHNFHGWQQYFGY